MDVQSSKSRGADEKREERSVGDQNVGLGEHAAHPPSVSEVTPHDYVLLKRQFKPPHTHVMDAVEPFLAWKL
jgi:hypothetical protein